MLDPFPRTPSETIAAVRIIDAPLHALLKLEASPHTPSKTFVAPVSSGTNYRRTASCRKKQKRRRSEKEAAFPKMLCKPFHSML